MNTKQNDATRPPIARRIVQPIVVNSKEEIFTHCWEGVYRHFPVRPMYETAVKYVGKCDDILPMISDIQEHVVDHIRKNMGIEQPRLDRLCEPYLKRPILGILWPDNQVTIIDGNHRYVKLWDMGIRKIRIFVFRYPFWEQFVLPLPESHNRIVEHSGIIEAEQSNG